MLSLNHVICGSVRKGADSRSPNGEMTYAAAFSQNEPETEWPGSIWGVCFVIIYTKLRLCVTSQFLSTSCGLSPSDAHQAPHAAICVTFIWWTMRGHGSDISFCLGSLWQRVSTLLGARMHDSILGFLKGHYPFSEHLTSSSGDAVFAWPPWIISVHPHHPLLFALMRS